MLNYSSNHMTQGAIILKPTEWLLKTCFIAFYLGGLMIFLTHSEPELTTNHLGMQVTSDNDGKQEVVFCNGFRWKGSGNRYVNTVSSKQLPINLKC